jgi:hypothetical protein
MPRISTGARQKRYKTSGSRKEVKLMTARQVQLLVLLVMLASFLGKAHGWVGFFDGH